MKKKESKTIWKFIQLKFCIIWISFTVFLGKWRAPNTFFFLLLFFAYACDSLLCYSVSLCLLRLILSRSTPFRFASPPSLVVHITSLLCYGGRCVASSHRLQTQFFFYKFNFVGVLHLTIYFVTFWFVVGLRSKRQQLQKNNI